MTAEAIRGMMTANSVEDTEIFQINISNADPELAALIANAVANIAPEEIATFLEGSSTKIIDYARVPQFRYTPSFRTNTVVGACIGGAAAVLLIIILTILDVRIRNEEDLEKLFDLPVLGGIPDFGGDKKYARNSAYDYSGYGRGADAPRERRPYADKETTGEVGPDGKDG